MTTDTIDAPPSIDWASLTDEELHQSLAICATRRTKADVAFRRAEVLMQDIEAALHARAAVLTDEALATEYMAQRDRKEQSEATADRADKRMRGIKEMMLARMTAAGTTGYKVDGVATVTRTMKKNVGCEDWTQFLSWVLTYADGLRKSGKDPIDAFAFLHRRVASGTISDWMDANAGMPPPAIKVMQEYDVSVRKAAAK